MYSTAHTYTPPFIICGQSLMSNSLVTSRASRNVYLIPLEEGSAIFFQFPFTVVQYVHCTHVVTPPLTSMSVDVVTLLVNHLQRMNTGTFLYHWSVTGAKKLNNITIHYATGGIHYHSLGCRSMSMYTGLWLGGGLA